VYASRAARVSRSRSAAGTLAGNCAKGWSSGLAIGSSGVSPRIWSGTSRSVTRGGVMPASSPLPSSTMAWSTSAGTPFKRARMFS